MWELDCEESWAPKNWCFWTVVLEKTLVSPLDCKEIQPVHPKDQSLVFIGRTDNWSWNSNTLATWCKESTHLKRPWCWERLKEGGEGDDRGWDGWMASPTQRTWVWVSSGSWWWTGRPDILLSMGSRRVRHDWATKLNWTQVPIHVNTILVLTRRMDGNWTKVEKSHFKLSYQSRRIDCSFNFNGNCKLERPRQS